MGDGRWAMGDGRWARGEGRWAGGDGRWAMGDGRWAMREWRMVMITRRDVVVAAIATVVGMSGVLAAQQAAKPVLGPTVFDWNQLTDTPSNVGSVRNVVRQPTATLNELEMHITTL